MTPRRIHYVYSTHWDREWYQPFQDYRYRLVQLIDRVIDALADGRMKGPFQTDGQAIILEDYLEVRPERRQQVEELVRTRRFVVGPWYVLPDEFLVSGESLIRNLRRGRELARSMGGQPSNAGFVCDIFGHNSQMPQILAGFGIPAAFIWRGLNQIDKRHIIWRGADGTVMPSYRFGHVGYCSYASAVRHAFDPSYRAEPEQVDQDMLSFLKMEAEHSEVDPILFFDGGDHQEWDPDVYAVLGGRMQQAPEGYEIAHTTLDDYMAEMLPQADRITTVMEGELREPGLLPVPVDQQWLIPGVLSSRAWIKQDNVACQTLLCHWAEPLNAYAHAALGREYPQGYLDVAWRWLLKNHPHDSICGCSIDAVHEDMKFRFSQCRKIADRVTIEAGRRLAASAEGALGEDEMRVTVFNPLPKPVAEATELTLQIPLDWPTFNEFFGFEPKPAFRIYDAQGQEMLYQRLGQAMNRQKMLPLPWRFSDTYRTNDVRVSLPLQIPAQGYTTLTVRAGEKGLPARHPETPGLATSERSMENKLLAVTIEPNGTLTLADKRNGQIYGRLLTYEDMADIGDGWYHGIAANDQAFVSTACPADVALVHNGPHLATFRIRNTMRVPAEFLFDRMVRSEQFVEMVIDSLVSLRPGLDRVEVQTTIHNPAGDHRVRVLLPSGAQADTYLADSPFDVVERPIALRGDNHLYRELEVETKPQQSWTAVSDGARGLAVVSVGQMESAVRDLPERPVALTLFRGTRRTVLTDGEPNGQLIGDLHFRYWVIPVVGDVDRVRLCDLGQQLAAGLRDVQLRPKDVQFFRADLARDGASEKVLPAAAGFLSVEGPAVVTSIRQVGEGLELRMFNPNTRSGAALLRLGEQAAYKKAQRVDLESNPLKSMRMFEPGVLRVPLKAKEIVTIRLS
jgi:alpha-mannosidase